MAHLSAEPAKWIGTVPIADEEHLVYSVEAEALLGISRFAYGLAARGQRPVIAGVANEKWHIVALWATLDHLMAATESH
jgi:hypothetical protein